MSLSLETHVARHLRTEAEPITRRWIEVLAQRLEVAPQRTLPGDSLLNQIPGVLRAVADSLEDHGGAPLDTRIRADLSRLAGLRRRQGFSLREILTEFGVLSELVEDAVAQAVETYGGTIERRELVRLVGRIKDAIYVLGAETASWFRSWNARQQEEHARLIGAYSAMLSHELRNRLGATDTAVRLLMKSEASLSQDRKARLYELMLKSVTGGLETVQSVQALFQPRSPGEAVPTFPMDALVRDAVHQLRVRAGDEGVELELVAAGPGEPVDAERFPLVFFNLVGNAIRHHDRPSGKGKVVVDVREGQDGWTVTVADNGPGVPPEIRDGIFDALVSNSAGPGLGLGLAIAREAAEQMGGSIDFECGKDRGTTFRLTVPRAPRRSAS